MSSINLAFLLTNLAGFATLLGTIPIFLKLKQENKIIAASLSFAAGVMLCVSITDLIPEAVLMLEASFSGATTIFLTFLFLMIGLIFSNYIDKTVSLTNHTSSLYKVGIISMIAIILHNLPEDCIDYVS